MNWRVSTLFEKWMEPLEALAWKVQGRRYDSDRIWYALPPNVSRFDANQIGQSNER